jgi:hypothetical protein
MKLKMIKLLEVGNYILGETNDLTKILYLSEKGSFAWVNAKGVGEILVLTSKQFKPNFILAQGKYRIYSVKDEPKLSDTIHLELFVGQGTFQGYLLITGFPNLEHKRVKIIPTEESITRSPTENLNKRQFFFEHT